MSKLLYGELINTPAFVRFIEKCMSERTHIHSFRFLKDGRTAAAADFAPYSGKEPMHVYSLSKAFTSIACGIACDEGLLSLDEKMCDIFPDKMPEHISERLARQTLGDVLSMQSGHARCVLDNMIKSGDSLKTFFETEMTYEPGTTFIYSTGGTLVCGAAVTRRSGEALDDYLASRLFAKLGAEKPYWEKTCDGLCYGGVGLRVDSDTAAKFGQMLANGGVYNGKRIVSEEYIKNASSSHALDVNNGSEDWVAGYGYQFWLNNAAHGGYRGDGAFGQLCIMNPEKNIVFVMECETPDMQKELNTIFEYIESSTEEDLSLIEKAESLCRDLYSVSATTSVENASYTVSANEAHIFGIDVSDKESDLVLDLWCDHGKQTIVCGNGRYIRNSVRLKCMSPAILALHDYRNVEDFSVFAAYENADDGIKIILRHTDLPHTQTWLIKDDKLTISVGCGDILQKEFALARK